MGARGTNSWVWQFFTRQNPESRLARCNICKETYNCVTTSNLKQHLDSMHPTKSDEQPDPNQSEEADADYVPSDSNASDDDESLGQVKRELLDGEEKVSVEEHTAGDGAGDAEQPLKMRKLRSFVWKYMKVVRNTGRRTVVECSLCQRNMTTMNSSTTNLMNHLRHSHPDDIDESRHDSYIPVPTNTEQLPKKRRRLGRRRRSTRPARSPADEDEPMAEFYLEDHLDQDENNLVYVTAPTSKRRKSAGGEAARDPMEQFARYATSLLTQLPSETAYRLQADFICTIVKHIEEKASGGKAQDILDTLDTLDAANADS